MNLIHDVSSISCNSTDAPRPGEARSQGQAENRRDYLVARGLFLTSQSGLLAVVAAICTTMIERGTVWRYSWMAAGIVFAVLMTVEIFEACQRSVTMRCNTGLFQTSGPDAFLWNATGLTESVVVGVKR